MKALIIEDCLTIRRILCEFLKQMGFEVVEAANGREGLDRLRELAHVDVVLVDWNMPEMNGIDFIRAVRADHAYDVLPLVMVTTNTEQKHVAEAMEAGADEYIMKPFPLKEIREKLELLGVVKT